MLNAATKTEPWFLEPGAVVVDNYKIEARIGRGGFSEVYRACNHAGRKVALKLLRPECLGEAELTALLESEAELRTINHPALVEYLICQRAEYRGQPFIFVVMDFVDGPNLKRVMQHQGPVPADALLKIAKRVAEGLVVIHQRRIIHRDISPDNIVLRGGDPKAPVLIDFGIAENGSSNKPSIIGEGFAGKRRYAAPEVLNGHVNAKTDLYALGATLLAAARGNPQALDHRDDAGELDTRGLEPRLAYLIERLTASDPNERLPSAYGLSHLFDTEKYLRLPKAPEEPIKIPPPKLEEIGLIEPDEMADSFTSRGDSVKPPPRPPLELEERLEKIRRHKELMKAQRTFWVVVAVLSAYGLGACTTYALAVIDALPAWPF